MAYEIDTFPGRTVSVKGEPHLYFGGTSYLGLQTDALFQNLFIKNVQKYGTNYGSSPKSNIKIDVYRKTEQVLCDLVGSEAALTLSSGYLTGQLLAQTLDDKYHHLFYAPNTHAALFQRKIKPFTTFTALNIAVREHLETKNNKETPVVFLDSIDFSGCNYPDFNALKTLPLEEIILVADDSHGIGVVGENGGGVFNQLKELNCKELIVCCSLGKGFAIQGGAILGSEERIKKLKNTAFFGGASPATPASLATFLDAQDFYGQKRVELRNHIAYFSSLLKRPKKFHAMKEHPAYTFADPQFTEYLESQKIIVTSFPYPDEDAQLMSRIVLSAGHKKEDIDHLLQCINILP